MTEFVTMRDIGAALGMTSHQIGKKLKELGLRTPDGKPTRAAFEKRLCAQRFANEGQGYCWAWDVHRVLALLGASGAKPDLTPPGSPTSIKKGEQSANGPKS